MATMIEAALALSAALDPDRQATPEPEGGEPRALTDPAAEIRDLLALCDDREAFVRRHGEAAARRLDRAADEALLSLPGVSR